MKYINKQPLKQFIIESIKETALFSKNKKSFIKFVKVNRKWDFKKVTKNTPLTFSIEFQNKNKGTLLIPYQYKNKHIQILVDKNYQLVKFTKSKILYKSFKFYNDKSFI